MSLNLNAFELATRVSAALDKAGIPYAIGGAIALGAWSDSRGTLDVDINLFDGSLELDKALDVLISEGVALDKEASHRVEEDGDVIIGYCEGMHVDLLRDRDGSQQIRATLGPVA